MNRTTSRTSAIAASLLAMATICVAGPAYAGDKKVEIIATTYPVHLITGAVIDGDQGVRLDLLVSPNLGCPHDYVMTPTDMRRAGKADVIVTNGLGLDDFINDMVADRKDSGLVVIDSSKGIPGLMNYDDGDDETPRCGREKAVFGQEGCGCAKKCGQHAERHEVDEHDHAGVNPHLFASPLMAAAMAGNIAEGLSKVRPSMAGLYRANAEKFAARMRVLDTDFKVAVGRLKNRKIVTQHGVFDYLARDAGLDIVAVIQAHPGTEPSASEMLGLVRKIRAAGAGAVFAEPQYGSKVPATIAREAGIPVDTLDPVATGPAGAGPDYYEKTMRSNILKLEKALGTR